MIYGILLFCVPLVILEGFFAASEISLVSANRRRLHPPGTSRQQRSQRQVSRPRPRPRPPNRRCPSQRRNRPQ